MTQARGRIYENITQTIGMTPIVRLGKIMADREVPANLLAKLEFFNPLASVKDRIGVAMIEAAEAAGEITPEKNTLIEPTSGNTGIGLAYVAAAKGYRLILTMPESMSIERRKMLALLGAKLVLTPKEEGMKGAIAKADELLKGDELAVSPGQFSNPANPEIHSRTTAEEIWTDTEGEVDILVAGVGTGGTLSGIAPILRERNPEFKAIAVEPEESPILSGGEHSPHKIQGIGAGFIPDITDTRQIDDIVQIDSETAFATAQYTARLEGIPVGISSGAAIEAAIQVGSRAENADKNIVIIISSFAERYLSTPLFENLNVEFD